MTTYLECMQAVSIETIEPLLAIVVPFFEARGWQLSGVQKTTSYAYEGAWADSELRSAYAFFHQVEDEEGSGPSLEAFIDETDEGLDGGLSLVLDGPSLGEEPDVASVLRRAAELGAGVLPLEMPAPVTVTYSHPGRREAESANVKVRFKGRIPGGANRAGRRAVEATLATIASGFDEILTIWRLPGAC